MLKKNFRIGFIGIGAQKSATTWIFQCLKEHPEICVSEPKETFYFTEKNKKSFEWYQSCFEHCAVGKIKGEYSTLYLSDANAPRRIHNRFPSAKLIACLRNPVERAYSNYNHLASKGKTKKSFKNAVKEFPEIIEHGFYYKHLVNYLKYFDKKNLLILIYDDIEKDSLKFIKKIYRFLNVNDNFKPKGINSKINTNLSRRSQVNKIINKTYLRLRKHKTGKLIINFFRSAGINKYLVDSMFKKPTKKSCLDKDTYKKLLETYSNDINNLEKLIGEKLPWH